MAYALPLPEKLARQGWKVKIRDRERVEPPHATILHRTNALRFGLRSAEFLDRRPDSREVPVEVVSEVRSRLGALQEAWNQMYPENPVA